MRTAFSAVLVVLLLAACAGLLPDPDADDARWAAGRWPGTVVQDLEHGRHLYVEYCAGCHELVLPHERTVEQWPDDLRRMQRHVRIPEADADFVERYILSVRARR